MAVVPPRAVGPLKPVDQRAALATTELE